MSTLHTALQAISQSSIDVQEKDFIHILSLFLRLIYTLVTPNCSSVNLMPPPRLPFMHAELITAPPSLHNYTSSLYALYIVYREMVDCVNSGHLILELVNAVQ